MMVGATERESLWVSDPGAEEDLAKLFLQAEGGSVEDTVPFLEV